MFLSVSIAIHNAESKLNKCIASIMNQTEKDFELILVDDGSSDNSLAICYQWREKYPNQIKVFEKKNSGSLLARRVCLRESVGDYLYVVDADDYLIDNRMFEILKKHIMNNNLDVIFFEYVTENTVNKNIYDFDFEDKTIFEHDNLKQIYELLLQTDAFNPLWTKIFSRELVDYSEDYTTYRYVANGTDLFQLLPIITNANKIMYIKSFFYFYRTHDNDDSIIHKFNPKIYISLKENFLRLKSYCKIWAKYDGEFDSLLRKKYMYLASTAVYKIRLEHSKTDFDRYSYLKSIGEDQFFIDNFTLRGVSFFRAVIVLLLRLKMYNLLLFLIDLFKKIYK